MLGPSHPDQTQNVRTDLPLFRGQLLLPSLASRDGLARMVSTSLATPSVPAGFREGDFVDVFYRISQDSGHYFPVANAASGTLRPRYGRTDGWMRAVLAEDWPLGQAALVGDLGATGSVRVRHTHPFWVNPTGELLDVSNESNMVVTVEARDVRPASDGRLTARPTLSVFVVRWGGEHTKFNNEEWGGAGASVSEQYIEWFLDKCVYATLGPDYEVCTRCLDAATPRCRADRLPPPPARCSGMAFSPAPTLSPARSAGRVCLHRERRRHG